MKSWDSREVYLTQDAKLTDDGARLGSAETSRAYPRPPGPCKLRMNGVLRGEGKNWYVKTD